MRSYWAEALPSGLEKEEEEKVQVIIVDVDGVKTLSSVPCYTNRFSPSQGWQSDSNSTAMTAAGPALVQAHYKYCRAPLGLGTWCQAMPSSAQHSL